MLPQGSRIGWFGKWEGSARMEAPGVAGPRSHRDEERVSQFRSLPVGWAALLIIGAAVLAAVILTVTGRVYYGTAGFGAGVVLTGTLLGLAAWDLCVGLLALRNAVYLALPAQITLSLSRRVVPFLSPVAFFIGILVGHQYWE